MAAKRASRDGKAEGRLRTVTEVRVERIASMMRRLEWERGVTSRELAREWKVGVKWVEELAAIASKRVRAELLDDKDHVGATVGAALTQGILTASRTGDLNALAKLAKVYSDAAGVSAATKVEVSGGVALDEIDALREAALQNEADESEGVEDDPAKSECLKSSRKRKASAPSS